MSERELDGRDRVAILVHYYRALIGRADVWRMRMDTTSNWAIGATAGVVSFALGDATVPHFVMFVAALLTLAFLLLEARRLTFYHLWQTRALVLEEAMVRPALSDARDQPAHAWLDEARLARLAPDLGTTVPTMPTAKAVARRLRRIYLYLFVLQLLAWLLKLATHPTRADSLAAIAERARMGPVSGELMIAIAAAGLSLAFVLAWRRGGVDTKAGV